MTLRRFSLPAKPTARAIMGLGLLALIGAGVAAANTEALVVGRFAAALEAPVEQVAIQTDTKRPLFAASEAYWLTQKRQPNGTGAALEPAAWSVAPFAADLSVGDRITISGTKGKRVLEVVSVREAEPAENTGNAVRDLAVTCREAGVSDGQTVTFVVPAEPSPRNMKPHVL